MQKHWGIRLVITVVEDFEYNDFCQTLLMRHLNCHQPLQFTLFDLCELGLVPILPVEITLT